MSSLRTAIDNAIRNGRLASLTLGFTVRVREVADLVGLFPPVSVKNLIRILDQPGNFTPGQPLCTASENRSFEGRFQTDLFCVGVGSLLWKFWTYNDGPWMCGVVEPTGSIAAGAPLAIDSTIGGYEVQGQVMGLTVIASCSGVARPAVNVLNQFLDGSWKVGVAGADRNIPRGANMIPMGESYSILVVDEAGALQILSEDGAEQTLEGPLVSTPLTGANFAPPGAPVVMDYRWVSMAIDEPNRGPLNAFVVDIHGALWVFELSATPEAVWTGSRMPNPNGVSLPPGASIATGYQSGIQRILFQDQPLGYCQLDVFVVDTNGTMQMWWESQGSDWSQQPLVDAGTFPPGAPIATGRQAFELPWPGTPVGHQLDVFCVDLHGRLRRSWVYKSGGWTHDQLPDSIGLPPGAHLATGYQQFDDKDAPHQLDVFAVDVNGRVAVFWQTGENPWTCETMPGSDLPVPAQWL